MSGGSTTSDGNPIWAAVDQRVDEMRFASMAIDAGGSAKAILENPAIDSWFKTKIKDAVHTMIVADDHELVKVRAALVALIMQYDDLAATVARGEVAAQRLSQMGDKK